MGHLRNSIKCVMVSVCMLCASASSGADVYVGKVLYELIPPNGIFSVTSDDNPQTAVGGQVVGWGGLRAVLSSADRDCDEPESAWIWHFICRRHRWDTASRLRNGTNRTGCAAVVRNRGQRRVAQSYWGSHIGSNWNCQWTAGWLREVTNSGGNPCVFVVGNGRKCCGFESGGVCLFRSVWNRRSSPSWFGECSRRRQFAACDTLVGNSGGRSGFDAGRVC